MKEELPFLKSTSGVLAGNPLCDAERSFSNLRPSRIFDQHFGLALDPDALLEPLIFPSWLRSYAGYLRPWRTEASQAGSTVKYDKNQFEANLDVQQFKPEEISVKLTDDNTISIEGKHEEKQDEHGYISRHFIRRYVLPENIDTSRILSKLSSDGVLTISAPTLKSKQIEHREIPIQQTGEPARKIQHSEDSPKVTEEQPQKSSSGAKEL
ncbi:hypothetical protein NQ318_002753 [Aromia moschata]|uniref:SHSP domain-containing protein n=1 Tax=Aromia moschata TaxID=1265417 RepID=A0AAV8Y315_9CUCU|nr:hypothetical protein NQ318_002753 [Aromia moschata]